MPRTTPSPAHLSVRTSCGRTVKVGMLAMPGVPRGARVTVAVDCATFDPGRIWLSLTHDEARQLAAALLKFSAAVASSPRPGCPEHQARPTFHGPTAPVR